MKRLGRTHRPFYRICVIDARSKQQGKAIEDVGTYNPMLHDKSKRVTLNLERVDYWISVGAQPTEKVGVLIGKVREGKWGVAKEPPAALPPKELPAPAAEAAAEATEATEAAAE